MPVAVVDDFACELPDAPRGSGALRNNALRVGISKSLGRKFRTRTHYGCNGLDEPQVEKSIVLIQSFLSNGKIFGTGKRESL
jgi:hypothetical protein